jgi:hypothetical protein
MKNLFKTKKKYIFLFIGCHIYVIFVALIIMR